MHEAQKHTEHKKHAKHTKHTKHNSTDARCTKAHMHEPQMHEPQMHEPRMHKTQMQIPITLGEEGAHRRTSSSVSAAAKGCTGSPFGLSRYSRHSRSFGYSLDTLLVLSLGALSRCALNPLPLVTLSVCVSVCVRLFLLGARFDAF